MLTAALPRARAGAGLGLGKYREIIIAVALFLLFDLGVLVLNFYTSFQISEDAIGINLSGRQRMLSQRTAKALLLVEAAATRNEATTDAVAELQTAVKLFDASLKGFQRGATVPGGDGKPVFLHAAEGPKAAEILAKAQAIWTPYQERLAPLLTGTANPTQIAAAVSYGRANNLKLLGLMNELTTALEAVASARANTLRMVQTGGIVLALLNFTFILFKFLRRLRVSDAAAEAANEENREILSSVREGLFLITPELQVGTQVAQSTSQLFGKPLKPGEDFIGALAPLVSSKDLEDARAYIALLFQPHVKESLVQSINPLSEVAISLRNRLGQDVRHHLSFQFNRVQDEQRLVRHLLVTVQDVTERVDLQAKLNADRQRSQLEFSMLLKAFSADPALLSQFVQRGEGALLEVNDILRSTSQSQSEEALLRAIAQAARRVHAIKGDAAMLGLDTLAEMAHRFESEMQRIRETGGSSASLGEALLSLPMLLEDLLGKMAALKGLVQTSRSAAAEGTAAESSINQALSGLVEKIATEQGKQVQVEVRMGSQADLEPAQRDLVREIAVQLARNAVTHGVQTPQERQAQGKDPVGRIDMSLTCVDRQWTLSVRDDGAGIAAEQVRAKLLKLGWYSAEQLTNFSERQIVEHIFKPGFSIADAVTPHAGRGAGLDLVKAHIQSLGARLRLSSKAGQFTEFDIRFTA